MSSDKGGASGGIGFFGLLTIVFIVLKLCKVVDWAWWIVLSPLYVPIVLLFLLLGFYVFCCYMAGREKRNLRR